MDKEKDNFITTFYHPGFPQLSPIPEHFLWNLQWVNFPFAAYFARKASTLFLKWLLMHFTIGVAVSLKKDLQVSVIIWARIPSSHIFWECPILRWILYSCFWFFPRYSPFSTTFSFNGLKWLLMSLYHCWWCFSVVIFFWFQLQLLLLKNSPQ